MKLIDRIMLKLGYIPLPKQGDGVLVRPFMRRHATRKRAAAQPEQQTAPVPTDVLPGQIPLPDNDPTMQVDTNYEAWRSNL